jgi:hypothetical protein
MMNESNAADWLREAHGIRAPEELASQAAQAISRTHADIEREVRKAAPQPGGLFDVHAGSFEVLCRGDGPTR